MYKSDKIAVTTSGTELILATNKSFAKWSVYPIDGDITVELYRNGDWGDLIYGFNGVGLGDLESGAKMRIKSITGTVNVAYYLRK